mgnify:CR=1 FL=1
MKKSFFFFWMTLLLSSFVFAQDAKKVQVDVIIKTTQSWNGNTLPNYKEGKPEITILKVIIPPKTKLPVHKHPIINAGVLTKGQLTVVTKDNKVLHMKEGDPIVEVVDTWHYGENEGDIPAEIIVFYAGIVGTPITVKK